MTSTVTTSVRTLQAGERYHWLGTPHPLQIVDDDTAAPVVLERNGDDQVPLQLAKRHATRETLADWYARRGAVYATRVIRTFAARAEILARPLQVVDELPHDALTAHHRGTLRAHWALFQLPSEVVDAVLIRELARAHSAAGRSPWCALLDKHLPDWTMRDFGDPPSLPLWRGAVDGTLVPPIPGIMQPVPVPDTAAAFLELAHSGVLIDLAGRPLTLNDCRWCNDKHTSGGVCPVSVACPTCDAPAGRRSCLRPSGHDASDIHARRREVAERRVDARIAAGDSYVAAPWPHAVQAALFDLENL